MKNITYLSSICIALLLLASGCKTEKKTTPETADSSEAEKGLKDYYEDYFPVGVAVYPSAMQGETAEHIKKHFNSMTPENVMKMQIIHPEEDVYNWAPADSIVDFAQENNLLVRGHTLCWHSQAGPWLFKDENGDLVSKEVLYKRLKEHITTVVNRYKGKVYAWDVVNEAISDSEDEFFRNSELYQIAGEEFVIKAFQYAHEADPDLKLFYNDYNAIQPAKRDKIYRLVKMIQDAGVPIHGVGMQAHISIYEPNEEDLRAAIEKYASLGVEVQITELDVSIYKGEGGRREIKPEEVDAPFTPEQEQLQIEMYDMIFRVFRDYKDTLTSVTFWNISDQYSWLDFFPVRGRKNYPLLFDENMEPKKAYYKVIDFE